MPSDPPIHGNDCDFLENGRKWHCYPTLFTCAHTQGLRPTLAMAPCQVPPPLEVCGGEAGFAEDLLGAGQVLGSNAAIVEYTFIHILIICSTRLVCRVAPPCDPTRRELMHSSLSHKTCKKYGCSLMFSSARVQVQTSLSLLLYCYVVTNSLS